MTWVRKDDQMPIHRKVAPLSDAAYRLLDEAICWSSRNLTDGAIGQADLKEISKRGQTRNAAELVARRLWHEAGQECPSERCPPAGPDGWVIHDYWEYQPSKDQVLKEREAKVERTRRWRERKKDGDGKRDASQDAPVTPLVTPPPPRPAPPRPDYGAEAVPPPVTAARRNAATAASGGRKDQPPDDDAPPSAVGPDGQAARAQIASLLVGRRRADTRHWKVGTAPVGEPNPHYDPEAAAKLRAVADPPEGVTA